MASLALLFIIAMMFGWMQNQAGRARTLRVALSLCLILMPIAAATVLVGCGGGSSSTTPPPVTGTPAGTYTLTVTATSGSTTAIDDPDARRQLKQLSASAKFQPRADAANSNGALANAKGAVAFCSTLSRCAPQPYSQSLVCTCNRHWYRVGTRFKSFTSADRHLPRHAHQSRHLHCRTRRHRHHRRRSHRHRPHRRDGQDARQHAPHRRPWKISHPRLVGHARPHRLRRLVSRRPRHHPSALRRQRRHRRARHGRRSSRSSRLAQANRRRKNSRPAHDRQRPDARRRCFRTANSASPARSRQPRQTAPAPPSISSNRKAPTSSKCNPSSLTTPISPPQPKPTNKISPSSATSPTKSASPKPSPPARKASST